MGCRGHIRTSLHFVHFKVKLACALIFKGYMALCLSFNCNAADITWTRHSTLTQLRRHHGSAVLNGTLYLLGGMYSGKTTEKLDTATGLWSEGLALKEELSEGCAVAVSEMEVVTLTLYGKTYMYNVETGMAVKYDSAPTQVWSIFSF